MMVREMGMKLWRVTTMLSLTRLQFTVERGIVVNLKSQGECMSAKIYSVICPCIECLQSITMTS